MKTLLKDSELLALGKLPVNKFDKTVWVPAEQAIINLVKNPKMFSAAPGYVLKGNIYLNKKGEVVSELSRDLERNADQDLPFGFKLKGNKIFTSEDELVVDLEALLKTAKKEKASDSKASDNTHKDTDDFSYSMLDKMTIPEIEKAAVSLGIDLAAGKTKAEKINLFLKEIE